MNNTHMKLTQTLGAVALVALVSCSKDDTDLGATASAADTFSLTSPRPGQLARYERIRLPAESTVAIALPDTLELRVIDAAGEGILVEERLSDGSQSRTGEASVPFPHRAFQYRLSLKPAGLDVFPESGGRLTTRLFPAIEGTPHTVAYAAPSDEAVALNQDRVDAPYLPRDRTYAVAEQEELSAALYHGHRAQGLPGFTYLHDRERGLHCVLTEHDLDGRATGWRRIE